MMLTGTMLPAEQYMNFNVLYGRIAPFYMN